MFTLKGRQDSFKVSLPIEFIPDNIIEKYSKILQDQRSFISKPIDFLNETIQKIEVLGITDATIIQSQQRLGNYPTNLPNAKTNNFRYPAADVPYRSVANPEALVDKTLNITFRHTLGYLNYFIIFESFLEHYKRDYTNKELPKFITIDLLNGKGSIYCKILIENPIIDAIDMLSFDYTQPIAQSQTFQVVFKYSDFKYEFIEAEKSNWNGEVE